MPVGRLFEHMMKCPCCGSHSWRFTINNILGNDFFPLRQIKLKLSPFCLELLLLHFTTNIGCIVKMISKCFNVFEPILLEVYTFRRWNHQNIKNCKCTKDWQGTVETLINVSLQLRHVSKQKLFLLLELKFCWCKL